MPYLYRVSLAALLSPWIASPGPWSVRYRNTAKSAATHSDKKTARLTTKDFAVDLMFYFACRSKERRLFR